ncbi:cytochrome P450 [Lyngbya confervoides]|uniref:Cytochrome P450 n=1 Tax=Lyngbya confervoides BDU141951 TaxID=1574623 RepID=A0ABD4T3L9_9CYAN|nr:cytochrome P450 [Lyngbya confervoides]MCM1982827.1 cytochrome P450 [Lyngbya confervoides BDU141951]
MVNIPTPPEPNGLQAIQWILNPLGYMRKNFQRYGDLFQAPVLWGGTAPLLMVQSPKALQYLLTHDTGKEFSAPGEVNEILEPVIGRQNVMLLSGSDHRDRRQLVMPPFHGDRLKTYATLIQGITQEVIQQWPLHQPVNTRSVMQKITMRVILQVVFGLYTGDRYEQLEQLLSRRLDMTSTPLASAIVFFPWMQKDLGSWSPGGRLRKLAQATDELIFAEIQERRQHANSDRTDILSLLMAATDAEGQGLSDQALRDELMALLVAGHETTATALTWALYWIHALPEVQRRLLAELAELPDPLDPTQFLPLPYLNAVCNETLRIHPVAMLTFPRRVEQPLDLCGYQLEPGMLLMGSIYLLHQREDLYPHPQQFRPERFLDRQFSPYEFMPFGAGVRRCVGAALAQYEMKIVLGMLLSQLELELINQDPVQPARRGVTLGQRTPVRLQKVGTRTATAQPTPVVA